MALRIHLCVEDAHNQNSRLRHTIEGDMARDFDGPIARPNMA